MIVTSQAFKQVPPILRVNASDVLVCWNLADVEVEKIADEYGSLVGTEKQFIDLYKQQIQKDPYTFLYLDFETGHVYKNFITLCTVRQPVRHRIRRYRDQCPEPPERGHITRPGYSAAATVRGQPPVRRG